jgi:hypothetical protein
MLQTDPRIYQSVEYGVASGTEAVATALYDAAKNGDIAASRFYLERVSGGSFSAPRIATQAPTINLFHVPAEVDQLKMAERFDRQMRLIDGSAEELTGVDP